MSLLILLKLKPYQLKINKNTELLNVECDFHWVWVSVGRNMTKKVSHVWLLM